MTSMCGLYLQQTNEEMILTDENIGQMPKHMEIMRHITKVDLTNNKIKSLSEGIAEIEGAVGGSRLDTRREFSQLVLHAVF